MTDITVLGKVVSLRENGLICGNAIYIPSKHIQFCSPHSIPNTAALLSAHIFQIIFTKNVNNTGDRFWLHVTGILS